MVKIMKMSKSKVLCYLDCPRLFKFRYVDKLKETFHPAAKIGKDVHDIGEHFFDTIDINTTDVNKHFDGIVKELSPDNPPEKMQLYLDNFLTAEKDRFFTMKDRKHFKPVFREIVLEHRGIKGIIDRVDYDPENGYTLIDYKTGTPKPMNYYMYELSLYAWLMKHAKGITINRVCIEKLKNKRKISEFVDITEKDMNKAFEITLRVQGMIHDGKFNKKKGKACYWCFHKNLCEKIDNGETRDGHFV